MRRIPIVAALVAALLLSGCGTFGRVTTPDTTGSGSLTRRIVMGLFTRVSMADLQFDGVVTNQSDVVADIVSEKAPPQVANALKVAMSLGLIEPVGPRLIEFTPKGTTTPLVVVCRLGIVADCARLPINSPARIYVQPFGAGPVEVYIAHRVSAL